MANPTLVTGACDFGTITAVANSSTISLANARLGLGASCSFTVDVTTNGAALGYLTSITSPLRSNEAPDGLAASASLFAGDPFQISFANLNTGDSFIDITNVGILGADRRSGTAAGITRAICANVYAFTPDEQLISCCPCAVTPNGLISLRLLRLIRP